MLESLALAPASWFIVFSLALAAGARRWLDIHVGFGRFVWLGIGAYVASYLLSNAWRLGGSVEQAVLWWQVGLLLIAGVYAVIERIFHGSRIGFSGFLVIAIGAFIFVVSFPPPPLELVAIGKWLELLQLVCIVALALECFIALDRDQLLARLVWAVVVVAEGFAALEYLDCQLLHDPHRPRSQEAGCSEIYGNIAVVAAPLVTTLALCYIIWMWNRARPRHGRQ